MLASTLAGLRRASSRRCAITSTDPLAGGSNIMFARDLGGGASAARCWPAGSGTVIGAFIGACVLGSCATASRSGRQRLHVRPDPGPRDPRRDGADIYVKRVRDARTAVMNAQPGPARGGRGQALRPVTALRDVNLHLEQGEVLGLLGDNGAGKSTLVKILCGFHKPDAGSSARRRAVEPQLGHRRAARDRHRLPGPRADRRAAASSTTSSSTASCLPLPVPLLDNRRCAGAEQHIDDIGVEHPVGQHAGAAAVGRSAPGDRDRPRAALRARILLLDEPLAAMGVKEGAIILDLIARLRERGRSR
jgi:energy-coupling factor transporter ATP-binding protein EcfA2